MNAKEQQAVHDHLARAQESIRAARLKLAELGMSWNEVTRMDLERRIDGVALDAAGLRDQLAPSRRGLSTLERVRRALGYHPTPRGGFRTRR